MSVHGQADDAALLRAMAMAAGDEGALQLLCTRHGGWLQARLSRRCADRDVVVDSSRRSGSGVLASGNALAAPAQNTPLGEATTGCRLLASPLRAARFA